MISEVWRMLKSSLFIYFQQRLRPRCSPHWGWAQYIPIISNIFSLATFIINNIDQYKQQKDIKWTLIYQIHGLY